MLDLPLEMSGLRETRSEIPILVKYRLTEARLLPRLVVPREKDYGPTVTVGWGAVPRDPELCS